MDDETKNDSSWISEKFNSIPGSTLVKNWQVWALLLVAIAAFFTRSIYPTLRGAIMIPMFLSIGSLSYLFIRSVLHRQTTDAMADTKGALKQNWNKLTSFQKILIFRLDFYVILFCATLLGMAVLVDFRAVIDALTTITGDY